MIIHDGKRYRGVSYRDGAFIFRYTDGLGREHRIRRQTIHEAIALYHTKKDMASKGGMPGPVMLRRSKVPFCEIARDALRYGDEHKRSAGDDHLRMKKLLTWFGGKRADSITPQEIEDKFQGERWLPATWNRYRALLSLAYRLAIRNGKAKENPARLVRHKTEHNERVRSLSLDEERKLRTAIREMFPEHEWEFDLALQTGLRLGEQYGARWVDVDFERRLLTVPLDKGGKTSHVPLNAAALKALAELHVRTSSSGFVCGGARSPRYWFELSLEAARIGEFTWHCLRHTFASRLVMSGADLRTVAELLRDKTLAMVMRYAHLAPDFRMRAVERMEETFKLQSGTQSGMSTAESIEEKPSYVQ